MLSAAQIDRIVAEVVTRLRDTGASTNLAAPGEPTSVDAVTTGSFTDAASPPANAADSNITASLDLTETLVTLSAVQDRLDGVKHCTVPPRAVVTPAVRDALRDRRITLQFRDQPSSTALRRQQPLLLVHPPTSASPASHTWNLAMPVQHLAWSPASQSGLSRDANSQTPHQLPSELQTHLVRGGKAVCMTATPEQTACQANRLEFAQAFVGHDAAAVHRLLANWPANLMVVPAELPPLTARQLVAAFAEVAVRPSNCSSTRNTTFTGEPRHADR